MLWVEVDWSRGVLSDEFAFARVEFEMVLCCCGLYKVQYFLASLCSACEHYCVVSICQVPEWAVVAVEPWLGFGALLCELPFHIVHDGAVDHQEEVWGEWATLPDA